MCNLFSKNPSSFTFSALFFLFKMTKQNINEVLLVGFFEDNEDTTDISDIFEDGKHEYYKHYKEFVIPLQNIDVNERANNYAKVTLNTITDELREYLKSHTEFSNVLIVACTDPRIDNAIDRCDMGVFRLRLKVCYPQVTLTDTGLVIESHKPDGEGEDKGNIYTMYTLPDREAWW